MLGNVLIVLTVPIATPTTTGQRPHARPLRTVRVMRARPSLWTNLALSQTMQPTREPSLSIEPSARQLRPAWHSAWFFPARTPRRAQRVPKIVTASRRQITSTITR